CLHEDATEPAHARAGDLRPEHLGVERMREPDIGPSAIVDDDDEAAALSVLEWLGAGYADELSEAERLADREHVDNLGRLRRNRGQTRPDEVRQASGRWQRQAQEPGGVLRIG